MNILPENSAIFKVEKSNLSDEAINYLDSYITKNHLVFQWGSGPLTFWLADRASKVYSVEYCAKKFHYFNFYKDSSYYDNVTLKIRYPDKSIDPEYVSKHPLFQESSFKNFCSSIEDYPSKLFDIIVIEGRCVNKCLEFAIKNGKSRSMVVMQSDTDYKDTIAEYPIGTFYDVKYVPGSSPNVTTILTLN